MHTLSTNKRIKKFSRIGFIAQKPVKFDKLGSQMLEERVLAVNEISSDFAGQFFTSIRMTKKKKLGENPK